GRGVNRRSTPPPRHRHERHGHESLAVPFHETITRRAQGLREGEAHLQDLPRRRDFVDRRAVRARLEDLPRPEGLARRVELLEERREEMTLLRADRDLVLRQ